MPGSQEIRAVFSLQALCYVSAALVVLNHSIGEFEGLRLFGRFRVDIFFVISGFVIYISTEKSRDRFLIRRIARIVPLYWLATLGIAAIALAFLHLLRSVVFDPGHLLASLLFFPVWTEATQFRPILILSWTLNFEMFFYLLFFLAMRVSHRHQGPVCAGALLAIIAVLKASLDPGSHSPLNFYAHSISIEFIFGILLGMAYERSREAFRRAGDPAALTLVTASAALFYLTTYDYGVLDGAPRFVRWGFPAVMAVTASLILENRIGNLNGRARALLSSLGDVSYCVYLVHIYVIAVLSRLLGARELGIPALFLISLAVDSILAHAVFVYFEKPARYRISALGRPRSPVPEA